MHFVHASADAQSVVNHTIRASFEYQGQKCSACSRAYIPDNLWPEVKKGLVDGISKIKQGSPEDFTNFMTTVIHKQSFDKCKSYIDYAKSSKDAEVLIGGGCDDSKGYFVEPTVIVTTDPQFKTLREEIFGPILTILVYPANEFDHYLQVADSTSDYALTGAIFAQDRNAIMHATNALRNAAGNFYVNDKCTGAVVGQQPFGGARQSGTNDKAGSGLNLYRWVSARTIKENFRSQEGYLYPSNLE
jgi:1-pyrroline-5-carboxylate dehydrogenase